MENLEHIFLYGIGLGVILYLLIFSNTFIKINVYIVDVLKKIVYTIIMKPILFISNILKKVIFKPFTFLFINIRKILSILKLNKKIMLNKKKKHESKKDFV